MIRKLERDRSIHKIKKKPSAKLPLRDILLFIGIGLVCVGTFYGLYDYIVHTSGVQEHTTESRGGPIFHPEEAPGKPGRRESAITGFTIAGFGILLIVLFILPLEIITDVYESLRLKKKKLPRSYRNRKMKN
jgi:hypothetical protein